MRRLLFASTLALALAGAAFAQDAGLSSQEQKASYAIGINIGSGMRADGVTIEPEAFLRGVKDALAKARPALSEEDMEASLRQLQSELAVARVERMVQLAEANRTEGEAFLKANAAKPGVVTTASGLQHQVLTAGTGPKPTASDVVRVNYRGTLLDGTEFDSSEGRGPATLPVGGVIPGWQEALQLMPVGSKWRLFVPSDLAYGSRGAGEDIGPYATLIFDVELLGIE